MILTGYDARDALRLDLRDGPLDERDIWDLGPLRDLALVLHYVDGDRTPTPLLPLRLSAHTCPLPLSVALVRTESFDFEEVRCPYEPVEFGLGQLHFAPVTEIDYRLKLGEFHVEKNYRVIVSVLTQQVLKRNKKILLDIKYILRERFW